MEVIPHKQSPSIIKSPVDSHLKSSTEDTGGGHPSSSEGEVKAGTFKADKVQWALGPKGNGLPTGK